MIEICQLLDNLQLEWVFSRITYSVYVKAKEETRRLSRAADLTERRWEDLVVKSWHKALEIHDLENGNDVRNV